MNSDIISKSILNEIEDLVYIASPETYELYYINEMCRKVLGYPSDEEWHRKQCYKVLQGFDEPCPFCTNDKLCSEKFYNWEHYNELLGKYFDIQDKLVTYEGISARLEIAKDITARKELEHDLQKRLEEQEALNKCIATLHTSDTPEISIDKLLALVAEYYEAERGYIFMNNEENTLIDNTHEWCAQGVEPQIQNLQKVDINIVATWYEKYKAVGEFYIDSLTEELEKDSPEFEILDMQGIDSLVTAPLYNVNKEIIGFLGVDNPRDNIRNTNVIRATASFVADFLDKYEQIQKLYKISYFDNLTGMQNRHSYSNKIATLRENPPSTLGVIYVDINGLKVINDKYGHNEGDDYIRSISTFIRDLYDDCAFRIGGDEFVMLCSEKEEWCFHNKLGLLKEFISMDEFPKAAIGYEWRVGNCNVTEQIEHADKAMYKEKEKQYAKYTGRSEIFRYKYLAEANHHG